MKSNTKPDVNTEILHDNSILDAFADKMTISLMESWSSRITCHPISVLAQGRLRVISFAPYTAQIFQVLDVTIFRVLKRRPRSELTFGDKKATLKFVMTSRVSRKSCRQDALEMCAE
jgi:hypothetical protein